MSILFTTCISRKAKSSYFVLRMSKCNGMHAKFRKMVSAKQCTGFYSTKSSHS
uniref:Uncharacterized protein n=1 Tax=Anguilla anguilla TaxID=7936 RepID=A0A0E9WQY6_ANGAN